MPSTPAILDQILQGAVREVLAPHGLVARPAAPEGFPSGGRASVVTLIQGDAFGRLHLQLEEEVLAAVVEQGAVRQDLANELCNLLAGRVEAEMLRRGVTIRYGPPRSTFPVSAAQFSPGQDGTVCAFECQEGRLGMGIELTLERGTRLDAAPTRSLPRWQPERGSHAKSDPPKTSSVLVVDDSESVRSGIVLALQSEGFEVLEADTALAALALLRERPQIGMIFTDLHMAGLHGSELIRKLKKDEQLAQIPVVVLTASPNAMNEIERGDVVTCLIKPISVAAVISIARRVLGSSG